MMVLRPWNASSCADSDAVVLEEGTKHTLRQEMHPLVAILPALRDFERELIDLGGEYDAELTDAMEIVQSTFPGARLVKFTQ